MVGATTTPKEGYVKGTLSQVPFPKAVNFINQAGKTGILALSQGKRKVHIHFDRGEIVYVTSSYFPEMSLGEFLVKEGKITQQVHEETIEATRNDKVKQGSYLVEKGHISPHDLYEALNKQVMRKLFKLFGWSEGDFFFREGEIVGEEHRILNISFANLLFRGIRSFLPMERPPLEFRGRKEDLLVKRFAGRHRIEDLKLGPAENRIYNLINGERTMRQVIALSNASKAVAYKTLYALFLLEMVGFPESFRSDRIAKQVREKQKPAADQPEGFEIKISNDVLAEAMASVDRIRAEVGRTPAAPEPWAGRSAPSAGAATAAPPTPEEDLAAKVEQTLKRAAPAMDFSATVPPAAPADFFAERGPAAAGPETDPFHFAGKPDAPDPFADVLPARGAAPAAGGGAADLDFTAPPLDESDQFADQGGEDTGLLMDVEDYTNPEDLIKQAGFLLDDANWRDARRFLERALELDENFADAYALLGWAVFNEAETQEERLEGERLVKKGMKINPQRYLHFLYLGKIYAAMSQLEFAELHFIKALELNIECSEAKEEIKRIRNK